MSYAKAFGQFVTDSEANSHCVDQAVAKANEVGDTFGQDGHKISSATAKGYTFFTKERSRNKLFLPARKLKVSTNFNIDLNSPFRKEAG